MQFNPSEILIVCCHIKRNLLFEDSMKRLHSKGFNRIWIQETGSPSFGKYQGPYEYYWPMPIPVVCIWEVGLKEIHKYSSKFNNWKYLFLYDFDLFLLDTNEIIDFINETIEGGYDHVSRLKDRNDLGKYDFKEKQIVHIPQIEIRQGNAEHDWPYVNPHFATGYEIFSRKLWDSYTDYDLSDARRMYREAVRRGFKMGAQFANYGPGEQCWGKEWFHVSNLTAYYHMVDGHNALKINPNNKEDLFKIGFFVFQEKVYGENIYPPQIQKSLSDIYKILGGKEKCLDCWNKGIQGKTIDKWSKFND